MIPIIQTLPLKVPCYLVSTRNGFYMMDTGDSSDCTALEKALDQAGVDSDNLKLILLTHGDFDHAGNAAFLRQKYGCKIAMHADDAEMVKQGDPGWNRKVRADRVTLFVKIIIFISSHGMRPVRFKPDLHFMIDDVEACRVALKN